MKRAVSILLCMTAALHAAQVSVTNSFELAGAIAQAKPGDTIFMRDGVWTDADILFAANGTATQPITLRAETLGRVHLAGSSRLRIAGNFLVVDGLVFTNGYRSSGEVIAFQDAAPANNCRIINCAIVDYNPPDPATDMRWVGIYGVSNRVEYCYFRGKTNAGSTLVVWVSAQSNAPNYHLIAHNYFGFRPALGVNGGETIRVGTSDVSLNQSRTTVEENYFERCNGDAEFISNKSCENIYRHNTFVECEGSLCLRHGNGCVVEGNYFFGNRKALTGGVRIVADDHRVYNNYFVDLAGTSSRAPLAIMQGLVDTPLNGYFQVHRAIVAFNTFVNCTNAFVVGLSGTLSGTTNTTSLPPVDCAIANNLVSQPAGKIIDQRITPENLLWQGNIFFGATLGITTNDGTSRVNPQLALGADNLWRPGLSSPALANVQGSYPFVSQDFEGQPRKSPTDIGCDQISLATPVYSPLTSSNVGPLFMRVSGTVLTWTAPADISYGTPLGANQLNASANASGSFAYNPPAVTLLDAGTGQVLKVVFTPNDTTAFNVVTQTLTINVLKATPTLTWTNPAPLRYGALLGGQQLNASADASGDFIYSPPAGTLLDVSNNQSLSVIFTPTDTNNYQSAERTVSINVLKGLPQISWTNPHSIEQGTPLSESELNATADVPGAFVYTPGAGATLQGGTRGLRAVFTPDDSARYEVVTNSVSIEVTIGGKRVPQITWPTPAPMLAGAPLGSEQLNAVASVPGRFEYSPPAGMVLFASNAQPLTVTFFPDDDATFTSVTKTVLIDVATLSSNAIVRVAYIIPSNRTPQSHAVNTLRETLLVYQTWLAVQMDRNGFGRKTITFETEVDGVTPVIHTLQVSQTDNALRGDAFGARVVDAAREAGLPVGAPGQLWFLIPETHTEFPDGGISGSFDLAKYLRTSPTDSGWAMLGSDQLALLQAVYQTNALPYDSVVIPDIGPFPLVDEVSFPWFEGTSLSAVSSSALGAGLRNLGKALGLDPDYRNDENFNGNIMGFGFRGIRGTLRPELFPYNFCALSYASALALDVNPFLNSGRLVSDTHAPVVSFLTTGAQTPARGLLEIRFQASDEPLQAPSGLHAAILTWERDGEMRVAEEMKLGNGETGGLGDLSFYTSYFDAEVTNHYAITVFDKQGNSARAEAFIRPAATFNRSPQPFITVRPLVAGIGQDIVMDASQTFDSEAGAEFLEFEWDIDGDGNFDTEPTTSPVYTNQYFTLGTHVIRARMTDPAGAVAVSAPVAVSITVCPTTLSPLTRFHGFGGSTGVIDVTVGPKCVWNVVNTNDWVEVAEVRSAECGMRNVNDPEEIPQSAACIPNSGGGPGSVVYNVLPNFNFADRQGYILVGDETFLVKQHGVECHISLSPASRFHGFGTGANSFKVTAREGCGWEVLNTNAWITLTSPLSGVSTGTVSYAIGDNRVAGRRVGNLVVTSGSDTEVFTVHQWGTNCELVLASTARSHNENAETGTVSITTASGCPWSVSNTNDWIELIGATAGTTTSNFIYVVAANTSGVARAGNLTINDQVFAVSQGACSYNASPLTRTLTYAAQSASVIVTCGVICPWFVANTNDWLTIEPGTESGVGTGTVVYDITENPRGAARVATFEVAGQTVNVIQSGKPCLFTIAPEEATFGESGGVGELDVTADTGCPWTVTNAPEWVTIISGAGEGPGRVTYFVAPNNGDTRTATLVVGGQDYLITQASAVRTVTAPNSAIASGQSNCLTIALSPHGGENSLAFSLCFDTNLLVYRSAKLLSWPGATLSVNNSQSAQGRVGFTVALPAGGAMTSTAPVTLQVCLGAVAISGRASTSLSFCDTPITRQLVDKFSRALPVSFGDASVDIIGSCSLAESLDANFSWALSSANAWRCQTNVTHDGMEAAESAPISDGDDAYFETTFTGPGNLSFWWKVSSEADKDRLRLYLDGDEQFRISGEVDWEWRSINIAAGSHDVRWRYSKGSSGSAGADRGWVDEIVYVPTPPVITSQPQNRDVDEGANAQFSVSATGQGPFTYQWLCNGNALANSAAGAAQIISGARTPTLSLSNIVPAQVGLYSVIVANDGGSVASAAAALNVTPAVSLAEALDATNLAWTNSGNTFWAGQAVLTHDGVDAARSGAIGNSQSNSFQTTVSGPGTLAFWWKVSSETNNDRLIFYTNGVEQARISGEVDWQQRNFDLAAGLQTLRWTYLKSSSTSAGQDRAWVDQVQFAPSPVTITAQPIDQNVDPGATAMLSVSAIGAPPITFQWKRDLVDIPGATNATLVLANISSTQSGNYSVLVSNPSGAVLSSNAIINVNGLVSLAEALDAPALFWTTNGTPPWVGQTGVDHDGEDAARSGRIGDSQTNSFETTVTGPGALSFWWKVSSETNDRLRVLINGVEQASIGGEVDWNWRLLSIAAGNQIVQWRYTKNSSASGGQDRGWVDEIIFISSNTPTPPVFTIQPLNKTIVAPGAASFSAIAIGSEPMTYRWLFNGAPLSDDLGISGVASTNLFLSNTTPALAGNYSLLASNSAGIATSTVATLTVIASPAITAQPLNQNLLSGGTADFSVTALGTAPLSYQWRVNDIDLANSGNIGGATSPNLRITNATAANIGAYSVVITNAAGSVTSAPAMLTISIPPLVIVQPTNRTVGLGSTATLTVFASGSGPLTYRWRYNGVSLSDGGDISGAATPMLQINNVKVARAGAYSVVISNAVGFAVSSNATLTVIIPPVITTHPFSRVVQEGTNVSFTVAASGAAPLTYQWRRDGTNLVDGNGVTGATTATLTLSNAQPEQSGIYSVEVANAGGAALSANAQLVVVPLLSLGEAVNAPYVNWVTSANGWTVQTNITHDSEAAAQSGNTTNGGSSWIETHITGPGTLRFWWKVSSQTNGDALGFSINGTDQARISGIVDWEKVSMVLPPGDLALRWSYNKDTLVTSGLDRGWLDEIDFVPDNAPAPPIIVLQPQSQNVNPGSTVTFAANALGTAPLNYQWRFEGQELSDDINTLGANTSTLRLFNVRADQSGLYDCVVRNAYGLDISTQVFLSVFTTVSLPIALDTERTNLLWFTGGYSPWIGQTIETKDQFDAAQSSPVANGYSNWVQTTLPFSCAVTFWWKVSSQGSHDYLRFLINGVEKSKISGEVGWQQKSFPIESNGAVLRWEYKKDASGSAGLDRGWLDQLQFLAIAPLVTNAAHNTNIVDQGTTIRLRVEASGTLPLTYQWKRNGTNITDDLHTVGATTSSKLFLTNAQPSQNGFYTCEVGNEAGSHVSEQLYVRVNPSLPLAPALNTPTWFWETGGYSWWIGDTSQSHDGSQSARPGYTDDGHTSWMRTSIEGPGTLRFWWRASTQPNADFLKFSINGVLQSQISGNVNWQQKTFTLPEGISTIQFDYTKDALLTNGTDQVFVDEVSFIPSPPVILTQPVSQQVDFGGTTLLFVGFRSAPPATYRWRFNGTPLKDSASIIGSSSPSLRIVNAQYSHSGAYSLLISNAGGMVISSNAQITVTAVVPLATALDTTNITWATGTPPWVGQTNISHDGVDAARSPGLGDGGSASLQGTVTGPGVITFWWRTSSEQNYDFLTFSLDDVDLTKLSGETPWAPFSFAVPEGDHVLRWTYSKDDVGAFGQDRGWVDQFTFTPTIPRITLQPVSQTVEQGTRVIFSSAVSGFPPFTYQWRSNGFDILDGPGISGAQTTTLVISNAQVAHSATYSLFVENPDASTTSSNAVLTVTPVVPLSVALDTTNLVWTTNSSASWLGQTLVSHDGIDAARSAAIGNNGSNWMQTTIVGPGTLSFWWKVSSETNNDRLTFATNGVEAARISGEVGWQFRSYSLGSGTQNLRWAYMKNSSTSAGLDRAWVDQVVYGPLPPTIVTPPAIQNIDAGGTANFRISVVGAPPLAFQWQRAGANLLNGGNVSGATSSNLVLANVQLSDVADYRVIITGSAGSVTSAPAALNVFASIPLAEALDNSDLTWTTANTAWTGHGLVTHDGIDAARSGAIGNSGISSLRTTVTGPGTLTFWWKVSSEPNGDELSLLIDGSEQARISGEVDWRFVSATIGSGSHSVEWRYEKDGGGIVGQDRAWVDQVRFGQLPPTITTQPVDVSIDAGQNASFMVGANGSTPLSYRWAFNGLPLVDGGNISGAATATLMISGAQLPNVGTYSVTITNTAGAVTSSNASLALWPTLDEALDAPRLTFTTGGTGEPWRGRTAVTHDNEDAAESGLVDDSTYTWIKTTVSGPGVLTFWWRTSSEEDHDWLRLMMDATDQMRISGELDWQFVTFNVPPGSHELQWRYSKNSSGAAGQDKAWVDQVNFGTNGTPVQSTNAPSALPPNILLQPVSQTVDEFTPVNFNVAASGTAPLSYRWYRNSTNLVADGPAVGGATTPILTLLSADRSQAGNYTVVITNSVGAVTSLIARLALNHISTLAEAVDMENLDFTTIGDALWDGHDVITHDGFDAARSGIVGNGQSSSMQAMLDGPGVLSFWWKISSETNADVLIFSVNDTPSAFVSGEVDWEQRFVSIGEGPQFLQWTYIKNGSVAEGADRAWVDQLSFVPDNPPSEPAPAPLPIGAISPVITRSGDTITLSWSGSIYRSYLVEYKDDLADAEWKPLDAEVLSTWRTVDGVLQPDTYTATVEDALTSRARFYRVFAY